MKHICNAVSICPVVLACRSTVLLVQFKDDDGLDSSLVSSVHLCSLQGNRGRNRVCVFLCTSTSFYADNFLTSAVCSAGRRRGFLSQAKGDEREHRSLSFLWIPLKELAPDGSLLWKSSSKEKRRRQKGVAADLFKVVLHLCWTGFAAVSAKWKKEGRLLENRRSLDCSSGNGRSSYLK